MAAPPLLLRSLPLLRLHILRHRRPQTSGILTRPRTYCTATESTRTDDSSSKAAPSAIPTTTLNAKDPPKYPGLDDPYYREAEILRDVEHIVHLTKCILRGHRKWKDEEAEIIRDVEHIVHLTKYILHSHRYKDGEHLTAEDEKAILDKLLAHHPHAEDKIGCGLDSIMVDRHPQFRQSRCLFVVRTDGGWIDFSYRKCLRAYIHDKYPAYAERFIKKHFKWGSS